MNATTANPDVRTYLEAVRAQLADVPEEELEELLDDLEQHLLEVAAEDDGTLEERLGSPATYAEELRASAGLATRIPSRDPLSRRLAERFERSALGRVIETTWSSKTATALRTFLPELRPGWWVLRGYLVVWAAGVLSYEGSYTNPLVPNLGSYGMGIAVTVGAIVASVAVGKAASTQSTARRFSFMANLGIIAATVAALMNVGNVFLIQYVSDDGSYQEYLSHAGGAPISNICPYSVDGKLLTGVLLFDQDGRAIDGVAPVYSMNGEWLDGGVPQIGNAYPRDFTGIEPFNGTNYERGTQTPLTCPPTLTGIPSPIPTPGGD